MINRLLKALKYMLYAVLGIIAIVLIVVPILVYFGVISIYDEKTFENSFSQFHGINKKDEYVIAEEVNNVTLNQSEYKYLFKKYPIGDSDVDLSLVAHFKYYIKLSELTHELDNKTLVINISKLYLSTPVSIDSASIKVRGESTWFGRSPEEIKEELLSKATSNLEMIGEAQINNVRDKAAESIAENLNAFLINNGSSGYYDYIKVVFHDDKKDMLRLYEFNHGFCDLAPCRFELEFIEGKTMVVE